MEAPTDGVPATKDPTPGAAVLGLASTFEPGAIVGRHVVLHELGAGGMGVVYAAYDPELDRKVALKLLLPGRGGDKARTRLLREAQALGKLAHPNVVGIHDMGTVDENVWLAMEFVQGQTLRAWLSTPRQWREVVQVMRSAGEGLAAAHAAGLLHRDFKPDNVMIGDDGRVRVMDFGLARAQPEAISRDTERSQPGKPPVEPLALPLTQADAIVGTLGYMAPEQLGGTEVTAAADQFAFCVTLWEGLYGERPFGGRTSLELMFNLHADRRRPPKVSSVPSRLRRVCERGLSIDPQQRWPSMEVLLAELRRLAAPRRWLALSLAGVGLSAVGLGIAQYAEVGFRCEGAAAQLEGIWDEERKEQVEAAILATSLVYAPGTWERVEQRLDDYAAAWIDKHTEVCEATRVTEEQTEGAMALRMGCLQQRRTALHAAVRVLAAADESVVADAVELVAALPTLTRCDDVKQLEQQHERLPPPEDPQVAQEVEALREQLAHIEVSAGSERAQALVDVESVVERAETLGYAPLVAEAKLRRGSLLSNDARYAEAEQDLEQAYALALAHAHDEVVLRSAQRLTWVVGLRQARHAEGLVWGGTALPLAERSGDAIALAKSSNNLGNVLQQQGKYGQAKLQFQRASEVVEDVLGADHPELAVALTNLGNVLQQQGEYEQAELHHQRALEILEAALGADHPDVAAGSSNLGNAYGIQGEYEQAKLHHQRALQIREKVHGTDHPDVAISLNNLGNVYGAQGDHEQAKLHYRRALQIREKVHGPDHPNVAISLNNLAFELQSTGEHDQAELHYHRALQILEKVLGADHPQLAYPLLGLVKVAFVHAELDVARRHAERAISILEASKASPDLLADARFMLAKALWPDPSQHARALELARTARDAMAELGAGQATQLRAVDQWLAEARAP